MSLLNKTLATLFCGLLLTACAHSPEKKSQASSLATQQVLEATSRLDNTFYQYKQLSKKKPVIALVLGSGGARGYAHIGVIEVLEQHGIKPDFIVGTSAGSIVGSIYASGKSPEQLRQIALNMKVGDVRDFKIGMKGFFNSNSALASAPQVNRENYYGNTNDYEDVDADMFSAKIESDLTNNLKLTNLTRLGKTSMNRVLTGINTGSSGFRTNNSNDPDNW